MSRIAPVPPQLAPPDVRAAYERAEEVRTAAPPHRRHRAPSRGVRRVHGIRARIRPASMMDARLTTLAAVKVASLVGCPF